MNDITDTDNDRSMLYNIAIIPQCAPSMLIRAPMNCIYVINSEYNMN